MKELSMTKEKNNGILSVFKGVLFAIFISLIFILIFAFLIKTFGLNSELINPINQIIKFASILIGVKTALKPTVKHGLIKGIFVGALYTLCAYLIFNILNNSFIVNYKLLSDMCFGMVAGLISAIIVKIISKD